MILTGSWEIFIPEVMGAFKSLIFECISMKFYDFASCIIPGKCISET